MRTSLQDDAEQPIERGWGEYPENCDSSARETFDPPQFSGEMFKNVFGNLRGAYTWDCDHVPSEEEIREGMCLRVIRDCKQLPKHDRCTELTAWHGGWTYEGIGIFTTEVWSTSRSKRTRRLGRASVMVRPPVNHGSRTWNGVAC